jgi:hypothetical protein
MRGFLGVLLSLAIAHRYFGVARPTTSSRGERLDQLARQSQLFLVTARRPR